MDSLASLTKSRAPDTSSHRVRGFQQIVAEIAVAGFNHSGMLRFKFLDQCQTRPANLNGGLRIKPVNVAVSAMMPAELPMPGMEVRVLGMIPNCCLFLSKTLTRLFQGPDRQWRQTWPDSRCHLPFWADDRSPWQLDPLWRWQDLQIFHVLSLLTKAVSSSRSEFARSSTVSKRSMRAIVVELESSNVLTLG